MIPAGTPLRAWRPVTTGILALAPVVALLVREARRDRRAARLERTLLDHLAPRPGPGAGCRA